MEDNGLLDKIKEHIRLEEGMDTSMLSIYLDSAQRYVKKKLGYSQEYLEIMVTSVMFEYRLSSEDLLQALQALEPIFALEVLTHDSTE
ncbi:head-tail connector protein [Lactococcus petauri]|uniref:head-tail connector protein n=1 Tax=Lactococcus petauri TaxID=1940789 RepID=UPI00254B6AAC|nr:head-tail connector protein [Lactococcus petauri]